jgi:hypothetical protein
MGMVYRPKLKDWRTRPAAVQRSAVWWVKYYVDGRAVRVSSKACGLSIRDWMEQVVEMSLVDVRCRHQPRPGPVRDNRAVVDDDDVTDEGDDDA